MSENMHLCDGQWNSDIKGNDNGMLEFELDQQVGFFQGRHVYEDHLQFPIYGICRHPGAGGVHRIDFWEPDTPNPGFAYYYFGIITPNANGPGRHVANGRRYTVSKLGPIPEPILRGMEQLTSFLQDDEWTGVKTT
jgi:hypothetical protein